MFASTFQVAVRILLFRAGPQDLPFAPNLLWPLFALAAAGHALVFSQVLSAPMAIGMAVAMVGSLAWVTRALLRTRNMMNRFQQTYHALLATSAVLTFALAPAMMQVGPQVQLLAQNPEMLERADAMPEISTALVFYMNIINIWSFAVTASIFRQASDTKVWVGLMMALIASMVGLFAGLIGGSIMGAIFGAPAPVPAAAPTVPAM